MRLTRRYRFAASHRLHTPRLSEAENRKLYGKCNNPFGHGHNYVLEVSVRGAVDEDTGRVVDVEQLDRLVSEHILGRFHYKNLNTQVAAFSGAAPTAENIAIEIRRRLLDGWQGAFPAGRPRLEMIRLYETRKNVIELSEEKS